MDTNTTTTLSPHRSTHTFIGVAEIEVGSPRETLGEPPDNMKYVTTLRLRDENGSHIDLTLWSPAPLVISPNPDLTNA